MPVICVYSPHTSRVSRRYYCLYCWDYLSEHAEQELPGLGIYTGGRQDAQHLGVLLGIVKPESEQTLGGSSRADIDMRISFPEQFMIGRVPFERWYPKGEELAEHIKRAKERLGRDVS